VVREHPTLLTVCVLWRVVACGDCRRSLDDLSRGELSPRALVIVCRHECVVSVGLVGDTGWTWTASALCRGVRGGRAAVRNLCLAEWVHSHQPADPEAGGRARSPSLTVLVPSMYVCPWVGSMMATRPSPGSQRFVR
jgi:hypothetical protein